MSVFTRPLRPEDIAQLIDLTVAAQPETASMATLQLDGVAALYNILCERPVAYLADEVGMGKTYQALALSAIIWSEAPSARILFISPREGLQNKWFDDYRRFFASNYRRAQGVGDDRVTSTLFGEPIHQPALYSNLRDWLVTIGSPAPGAPLLRHTSFTRPIFIREEDTRDLDALWAQKADLMRAWGLNAPERPEALAAHNASHLLNLTFARALNARLAAASDARPYFDLVIVDEAQCLRHPDNQTNTVLYEALRGQVDRWLFMSATPAHGGPGDICAVVNHYPCAGELIDPQLVHNLPAMQAALETFMVRRQRRYQTLPAPLMVSKDTYRAHQAAEWGVEDASMSVLETLSMGLVQKELVSVLRGQNNRYQIGFLSSFESLQSSLMRATRREDEDETRGDWHHDQAGGAAEPQAPDAAFIRRHAEEFSQRFGAPLPHPKLDAVVSRVAPLAFGADSVEGGHKTLIFTRRVSTVAALRDRLTACYLDAIKARIHRCWGGAFDWREGPSEAAGERALSEADEVLGDDAEEASDGPLRAAMAEGGWLFKFRQTFRASGRNALCFEDGWLSRLCQAGGVTPRQAAARLSKTIWAESWTHASRSAGPRQQQHRAARLRYIAVQSLLREPHIFNLDAAQAAPWRAAYEAALHNHLVQALPDGSIDKGGDLEKVIELFEGDTLWTAWDARFAGGPLALPGAAPRKIEGAAGQEALHTRQVARTVLGQTFRLTDTLIDLLYADRCAQEAGETLQKRFLDWLTADDPASRALRRECAQWIAHLRLIVDSCLDGAGRTWRELAREEAWPTLFSASPVVGITGSSGPQRKAVSQFRTPSMPRVIVCTDTLKEGVDLHLFCDRVVHYGVAWTSGDLEQRVGRVDRFFSQIERRLSAEGAPPDVQLTIGYPHIVSSLERAQIERVIARQRDAERLMDSPLAAVEHEPRELIAGASAARPAQRALEPYRHIARAVARRDLDVVDAATARAAAAHYERWYAQLTDALRAHGWQRSPDDPKPTRVMTLFGHGRSHTLSWSLDPQLGRYILTLCNIAQRMPAAHSYGVRRSHTGRGDERFIQALVPTPHEGADSALITHLLTALAGDPLNEEPALTARWEDARLRACAHTPDTPLTLRAYDGGLTLLSALGPTSGPDPRLDAWKRAAAHAMTTGYLTLNDDLVCFGAHLLHGDLSAHAREHLLTILAQQATRLRRDLATHLCS